MTDSQPPATVLSARRTRIRWWPALMVIVLAIAGVIWIRLRQDWPYQSRNLASLGAVGFALALLWLWWLLSSNAPWRWRLWGCGGGVIVLALLAATFRIRGVSGDLLPILEPRWAAGTRAEPVRPPADSQALPAAAAEATRRDATRPDFPQFLGPDRNGIISGTLLGTNWIADPPRILWRQPIGPAWSGFAIVGHRAVTQEQAGSDELVTCYDLFTGRRLWAHADRTRYHTTIAGEGPRATPTVVGQRVIALGANGQLNCLALEDGQRIWSRLLTEDARSTVPEWGFAGSPLHLAGRIVVSAGGRENHSLLAYGLEDGGLLWAGGSAAAGYSSPAHAVLAGVPQLLMFNSRRIGAHDPESGAVLWEYPWGVGHPHVAQPVVTASNRVVFSSGYGVGAEMLEIARGTNGALSATRVWKSIRLKAKFANVVTRDGHLYGLDDGVLACLALEDGSLRWKEGRYGHGQMLLVGDLLLLTAESGELVLLQPTPEAPNERHRFAVFDGKTWNPPALSGEFLLMRNDREAACLRLPPR